MRVLVVGGSGYVGSVLCKHLLGYVHEETYKVTVLDNLMFNQKSLLGYCYDSNFNFIKGDVRNCDLVKELVEKNDVIINLAFYVGAEICDKWPNEAITVARWGIDNILKAMSNDQLLIYPMTNSGYGKQHDDKPCTEESPLTPVSLYGTLKVEVENTIIKSEKKALIFRLATVFGVSPRMRLDLLVNNFVYKAYKDKSITLFEPNFRRNYIHVDDVSRIFVEAIKNSDYFLDEGLIFNLGNDEANCTKLELANKIKTVLPETEIFISEHGTDPDKRDYLVSNAKIYSILPSSAVPSISIEEGVKQLVMAYNMISREDY